MVRTLCKWFMVVMVFRHNAADSVSEDTELVFAFMVHRHADRTPLMLSLFTVATTVDISAVELLTAPWGYGQLTNEGLQRSYKLGQFIRQRYNSLLSPIYNASEIYIRSTDTTRAKMTALTAMAAVYRPVNPWSEDINWVPVPYTTVPAKYDYNVFELNCPVFQTAMINAFLTPHPTMERHNELLRSLTRLVGLDLVAYPALTYLLHDNYVCLQNLGYELSPDIIDLMPELEMVAADALDIIFGDERDLAYTAGPLLHEFFKGASAVIAGNETERVRVYSAHDLNVYALQSITRVNKQGVPKYASLYSLELRRVVGTGEYVVLPVYLPTPGEPAVYLQVEGCGTLCEYEKFHDLTSQYALPEDEWRTKCGFTDDLDIGIGTSLFD